MFWNKKPVQNLLGVPLEDLLPLLNPTSIKAHIEGNVLIAREGHYITRVEVIPPEIRGSENLPVRAVVRIKTDIPAPMQKVIKEMIGSGKAAENLFNALSSLSALTCERESVYIGSRLTIYEAEDESVWRNLHVPFILFSIIFGATSIMDGMTFILTEKGGQKDASAWTKDDLEQVHRFLSKKCVCTAGDGGLTAEFGLEEGAVSAFIGDRKTALFKITTDQPHPVMGGGLFCLLQMPYLFHNEKRLQQVCTQMNNMEMAARDQPPHFGAWCKGPSGNNPGYVSFLPNVMHDVAGVAVNAAAWAMGRAKWANKILAGLSASSR